MGLVDAVPPPEPGVEVIGAPKPNGAIVPMKQQERPSEWAPVVLRVLDMIATKPELLGMLFPGMAKPVSAPPRNLVAAAREPERRRVEAWEAALTWLPVKILRDRATGQLEALAAWVKAAPDADVKAAAHRALQELDDDDVKTLERIKAGLSVGAPSEA